MKRRGDLTRIQRYIERQDSPTVAQVLGRFKLPPGDADGVRELVESPEDGEEAATITGLNLYRHVVAPPSEGGGGYPSPPSGGGGITPYNDAIGTGGAE